MKKYAKNFLANALRSASVGRDDTPFLILMDKELSYGAFFENAEKLAAVMVSNGVKVGDRVAVQAPKTGAMLELYIAIILVGGVFLPLNPEYTTDEVSYFLGDAKPKVLVCDPDRFVELNSIAINFDVGCVLTLGEDEGGTLTEQREQALPGFVPVERSGEDLAAILYTSGTTGRSKGAMLSHAALASNSETLRQYWKFTSEDVLIHALPIFHTHGLFVATNVSLMAGSSCIFMPRFDQSHIVDAMPKATVMMGVPTFYVRLLNEKKLKQAAENMRLFVSGSAPLLSETHRHWQEITGHNILERYGMTETNMNTSNPYDGERRPGTVGFPFPGVELKVCDPETGLDLKTGKIGVIEVRGSNLFKGYWNMPEKTAEEFREDGFFITGDLGKIDVDGYVHILGRDKDLIISGGFNVYPKEVETLIDDIEGVVESAVFGVPHDDFGEAVVAVVVSTSITPELVIGSLTGKLARFKQPKKVFVVDFLPRNTMGKVQKNRLRDLYASV